VTIPASVAVTTPSSGSQIKTLTSIAGTTTDNNRGSGIARVEVFLRRKNSSNVFEYWALREGTWGWSTQLASMPVKLSVLGVVSTSWSLTSNSPAGTVLPSGLQLSAGTYSCVAHAYDKAGNKTRSTIPDNSFRVDATAPASVVVTTPAHGSTQSTLQSIAGYAQDNAAGSGISRVEMFLRRKNSSNALEYWGVRDGIWGWSTSTTFIPTTLTSPGAVSTNWSLASNSPAGTVLPSDSLLPEGAYSCGAYTYDKAGNRTRSTDSAFTVKSSATVSGRIVPGANTAGSNILLSSARADSNGSVTLVFTGAVKTDAASDASRYTVTGAGGDAMEIESVALKGTTAVVLNLPSSATRAGDKLTVTFDLLDLNALQITGSAEIAVP
jgi:hypothetical protein